MTYISFEIFRRKLIFKIKLLANTIDSIPATTQVSLMGNCHLTTYFEGKNYHSGKIHY